MLMGTLLRFRVKKKNKKKEEKDIWIWFRLAFGKCVWRVGRSGPGLGEERAISGALGPGECLPTPRAQVPEPREEERLEWEAGGDPAERAARGIALPSPGNHPDATQKKKKVP